LDDDSFVLAGFEMDYSPRRYMPFFIDAVPMEHA